MYKPLFDPLLMALIAELRKDWSEASIKLLGPMAGEGITYQGLLDAFKQRPAQVVQFLNRASNWALDNGAGLVMPPYLEQGGRVSSEWEGQPVVWNGEFTYVKQEVRYVGTTGPAWDAKPVSRIVKPTDKMRW